MNRAWWLLGALMLLCSLACCSPRPAQPSPATIGTARPSEVSIQPESEASPATESVISPELLKAVQRSTELDLASVRQFEALRQHLKGQCEQGDLDACFAREAIGRDERAPHLRGPGTELDTTRGFIQGLIASCRQNHPPSCVYLGLYVLTSAGGTYFPELMLGPRLRATLRLVLVGDPKHAKQASQLAHQVDALLAKRAHPKRALLDSWSRACLEGSGGACLLGGAFNWESDEDDDGQDARTAAADAVAYAALGRTLLPRCHDYPSQCAEAARYAHQARQLDDAAYCRKLEDWCGSGQGSACYQLAGSLKICQPATQELPLLERACDLGIGSACRELSSSAKTDTERLELALRACQASRPGTCGLLQLVDRMHDLSEPDQTWIARYACEMGDWQSCVHGFTASYRRGELDAALAGFSNLCQRFRADRPCRLAAQVAYALKDQARAEQLLRERCNPRYVEGLPCVELARLLVARDARPEAVRLMHQVCNEFAWLRGEREDVCGSHTKQIESGPRSTNPSKIFFEPLDE